MKFKIDKYLLKKTEELAFITVKKEGEFHLDGYEIPKEGLNVPIKNEVLVKGIKEKTAQDGLNSISIADAMIYIIGIDPEFRYNDEYKKYFKTVIINYLMQVIPSTAIFVLENFEPKTDNSEK